MKSNLSYSENVLLAQLGALAATVRSEVDAVRAVEAARWNDEDGFTTSKYKGRPVGSSLAYRKNCTFNPPRDVGSSKLGDRSSAKGGKVGSPGLSRQARQQLSVEAHNQSLREPGELMLRDWLKAKRKETGWGLQSIRKHLYGGKWPHIQVRRLNLRLVFVKDPAMAKHGRVAK